MTFHFKNTPIDSSKSYGNGDDDIYGGDEMLEFVNLQRSLSRPTDHYHQQQSIARPNQLSELNPYAPPPRTSHSIHNISRYLRDPVSSALNQFSKVTNLVLSPTNYDDDTISPFQLIKPPGFAVRASPSSPKSPKSPRSTSPSIEISQFEDEKLKAVPLPPPALPPIPCTVPQHRLPPLTSDIFYSEFIHSNRKDILERIFRGGIHDNELRRRLWPLILGLTDSSALMEWNTLNGLFQIYNSQWKAILPEQETRFTAYRERKSLIERDVVRCDRTHPFYSGSNENLEKLRELLLTYTMYDFDTGYVQGMSDLASPLLYVWDGDVMKAFWCFVQVMKLIGCNFELSQASIKYQLEMLWKLIELTDPCFAQYLVVKDSSNCYFAFRWIVCQFKREFMKTKDDDYDDCLLLWESIWCASVLEELESNENGLEVEDSLEKLSTKDSSDKSPNNGPNDKSPNKKPNMLNVKQDKRLKDAELYTLSICLSIIRRERDLIMANSLDATEILKHFNNLKLNDDLWNILVHTSTIWYWLKHDAGEALFYKESEKQQQTEGHDDFDLLNEPLNDEEYLIINSSSI